MDLLLQHAELVAHHDDPMEKDLQRNLLGRQRRVGRVHDEPAALPAQSEFFL
jgi:hypothetical protein